MELSHRIESTVTIQLSLRGRVAAEAISTNKAHLEEIASSEAELNAAPAPTAPAMTGDSGTAHNVQLRSAFYFFGFFGFFGVLKVSAEKPEAP